MTYPNFFMLSSSHLTKIELRPSRNVPSEFPENSEQVFS
jgi:hypothetical protein